MSRSTDLAVVIMAAGKGTRLKSQRPKVLHEIAGRSLLAHVISAATRIVAPEQIFVIVGYQADKVRAAVAATGVQFIDQPEQRGTGHAIQCAASSIATFENVLVLSGDVPLIRTETIEQLWQFHQAQQAAMTILTACPEDPTGYGRILRSTPGSPDVSAIIEQKSLAPDQLGMREINSGIYAFRTSPLLQHLAQLSDDNSAGEFYLTDMASLLTAASERVVAIEASDSAEVLGANTLAELATLDQSLRSTKAKHLMANGVTIFRPDTVVIDAEVEVAPDTIIEPFVQLLGCTKIGPNTRIRSYTVIENCTLGADIVVQQSCVLKDSTIHNRATIGPFAHLRPGSEIGEEAHVGNFVETKNARLDKGVKAGHLTYLGDAEIGEATNIGAGTITCNYDGMKKHRTKIGKNAFVGSDSALVAPVEIGDGAYIGAGSTITRSVPADSLSVGRSRQVTKEGWATARRARQQQEQKS